MRYLLRRITFLIIIMTMSAVTASADKYSRAWKKVDAFLSEDLPESAAEEINRIWDMAAKDGDSKQMLKSAVYMTQAGSAKGGEKDIKGGISLLETLMPKLGQREYKAICHALIARGYQEYWNDHRWIISGNVPTDEKNPPLEKWTVSTFCDTICYHLEQSVDMAGEANSSWFEDFFPGGNKDGLKLRPTLADMLLDNATVSLTSQLPIGKRKIFDDGRLYGPAGDFVNATMILDGTDPDLWELYILSRMAERNLEKKAQIRSSIDYIRMEKLLGMLGRFSDWTPNHDKWVEGTVNMGELYLDDVSFSTLFFHLAAEAINDRIDWVKETDQARYMKIAQDLCDRAIRKWPKSEGAYECRKLKADMQSSELELQCPLGLVAGGWNLARIDYRNVGTVYLRAVEVPGEYSRMDQRSVLEHLSSATPTAEWSVQTAAPGDHLRHSTMIEIQPLMEGSYYIVASTGRYFGQKDIISYIYLECSSIELARVVSHTGAVTGYTVNRRTGQPVADVRYTLWQLDGNGQQTKVAERGMSAEDGYISIEGMKNGRYSLEMELGSRRGRATLNIPYNSDMVIRPTGRIYTDRYSYRPGDSVQFACIVYETDGYSKGRTVPDMELKASFLDTNWKEIQSMDLVTDSMGQVRGVFQIPESVLPGSMTVRLSSSTLNASQRINVESFRQSTFEFSFDPQDSLRVIDSPVTVTGKAVSNTGAPIAGAKYSWYVSVGSYLCSELRVRDTNGDIRIDAGEGLTSSDGSFSMTFTLPRDILVEEECSAQLSVTVTDLNGEVRSGSQYLRFGAKYRSCNLAVDGNTISPDGTFDFKASLYDVGRKVKGKAHIRVSRLEWTSAPGLDLSDFIGRSYDASSSRRMRELSESVRLRNLQDRFPEYELDFEKKPVPGRTVFEKDLDMGHEEADLTVNGLETGLYRFVMTSDMATEAEVDVFLVRSDDNSSVPGQDLLWLNRPEYETVMVGDTATVSLGNCWKGTHIYYMVENRFGIVSRGMMVSDGTCQQLRIPVTEEMQGGFSVHAAVIYLGVTKNVSCLFDVPYSNRELKVSLVTFRDRLQPGVPEQWSLKVTDSDGNPLQAALLVDMYDKALDVYGANSWLFMPWYGRFFESRSLFERINPYADSYDPRYYDWDGGDAGYKGKKAITGTLLNPFQYSYRMAETAAGGMRLKGRGVALNDAVVLSSKVVAESGMAMDEESVTLNSEFLILDEHTVESQSIPDENISIRENTDPTGLFVAGLMTDSLGVATIGFTTPELLTKWNLQGFAYTASLMTGSFKGQVVTAKEIMLETQAPRFVRQGDVLDFTAKISNTMESDAKVVAALSLTDAITGRSLDIIEGQTRKTLSVAAGSTAQVSFRIRVPGGDLAAMTYVMTAQTSGHSDGMKETIPVLTNRTQVVQAMTLFNNGNEKRSFHFTDLEKADSPTMGNEQLTLEYSSSPIWYAIQALPSIIRLNDPSNIGLFHSFMGAAMSQSIVNRYPSVSEVLDEWAAYEPSDWETELEKNQTLKGTLLDETPWLRASDGEKARRRALAQDLNTDNTREAMQKALDKLIAAQLSDGGWPWIDGGPSSVHVTDVILRGLGVLHENDAFDATQEMKKSLQMAINFLDGEFYRRYDQLVKPTSLGVDELGYLLTRSYFLDMPFAGSTGMSYNRYLDLAERQDTHEAGLYYRAELAMLMSRLGKADKAAHIAQTLLERSVCDDEMGRYWKDNQGGYIWHEAPIETQAEIIGMLMATGNEKEAAQAARWLLKQKQTTGWGSSPATAAAVVALMATGGSRIIGVEPDITITLGRETVKTQGAVRKADGGYLTRSWNGPLAKNMANVTVDSRTEGISWGAVYRSFTEELDNVEHSESGMHLKRSLWRVVHGADTDRLEEVVPGMVLHVGDRVKVRFDLTVDRTLEYLQLKDMRAASFEPVSTRAGYSYNFRDDIRYYSAPGNTRSDFYIDRLSAGSYVIEYEVNVQKPGTFQGGNAVLQCLYAPAFRATTESLRVTVE